MKKKILWLVLLSVLLALLMVFAVFGETIVDLILPVKNDWDEDRDGNRYYMNEESDPVTGWFDQDGNRYYLDPANGGAMHTGWLELTEGTYYLDEQGHMVTGWQTIDSRTCYFGNEGAMATGWLELEDGKYYLSEDGTAVRGWLTLEENTHYLDEQGHMVTGWLEQDGKRFYFDEAGIQQSGWLELDGQKCYLNADGSPATGWQEFPEGKFYLDEQGFITTGWLELEEGKFYLNENGNPASGWVETEEGKYYINENGTVHTGWLEADGQKYYLKEDGTAARGKLVIDEKTCFFTSTGANIILVNTWNEVPEDYEVELKSLPNGKRVAAECYDALEKMLEDCTAAGCHPQVIGGYRTIGDQRVLLNNKVASYQEQGYGYSAAYAKARLQVALPGTSEHHLGLAVDILDKYYPKSETGDDNCLVWLAEHCWEYGFIIRYPNEKTDITGIKYEPWHYRYVGVELAMEMKDSGLCLEEYMDQLTGDGTTCGNPDAVKEE